MTFDRIFFFLCIFFNKSEFEIFMYLFYYDALRLFQDLTTKYSRQFFVILVTVLIGGTFGN